MKNLKKYIRRVLKESSDMEWLTWNTFSDCYNGLSKKFQQDFDACIQEDMIGEEWYNSVKDVDMMAEEETLEDKFYDLAHHTNWSWDVSIFRRYSNLHTPDRVMTALWFIANKQTYISNFAFAPNMSSEEFKKIGEQCKKIVYDYGLPTSFNDIIDEQVKSGDSDRTLDKAVGHRRPFSDTYKGDL